MLCYDTEARWHFLSKIVVEQYAGKVVKPPGTTKTNRIEQLEKSDRGWGLRKAGPERGMKVVSARNPRLGTYICYGVKTVTTDKMSAERRLLDFVGDTVLEKASSEAFMRDLLGMFDDSYQNSFFSFYGLSNQTKGHAVGLYRQYDSVYYFDSNVGEFTMPLPNLLGWFRDN